MKHSKSRRLSQNFLKNKKLVHKLILKTSIKKTDTVLDIGFGKGILSECLSEKAGTVLAYEYDSNLYLEYGKSLDTFSNIKTAHVDFLKTSLPSKPYKVFSNIPFHIAGPILKKVLLGKSKPEDAYFVLPTPVIHKYSDIGDTNYKITHFIAYFYKIQPIYTFKSHDFSPKPAISCQLIRFERKRSNEIEFIKYRNFIDTLYENYGKSIFQMLKKTYGYNFSKKLLLELDIPRGASVSGIATSKVLKIWESICDRV